MTPLNVIVADDDDAMRHWLSTVLARMGASVEVAASGWELLSLLANETVVDLVISDVRMPRPGGLQALALARASGIETPFLLITAFGDERLRGVAQGLRADVLDKPFRAADLAARIGEILVRTKGW